MDQGHGQTEPYPTAGLLRDSDLVPDRALQSPRADRFGYASIAGRVADLVTAALPPLNVAIFGPWGSGKSSLGALLATEFEARNRTVRAARARVAEDREPDLPIANVTVAYVGYDAWKYGGRAEALRRNFISHTATELGYTSRDGFERFHEGLYEGRRRVELAGHDWRTIVRKVVVPFAWVFLLLSLALGIVVGLTEYASDRNLWHQLRAELPAYLGPAAVAALVVTFLKQGVEAGSVNIERHAPADDEEFGHLFSDLLDQVTGVPDTVPSRPSLARRISRWGATHRPGRWIAERQHHPLTAVRTWLLGRPATSPSQTPVGGIDRIVFFIDELDRCDPEDVVETLVAIKTFLDDPRCVFVLAADRAVLEEALGRKAQQATPIDEDSPYYTTAGAFLDKIFQHQIALPPLRGRRLTSYAKWLVTRDTATTGLWGTLGASESLLDDVLYALIPSHVRSPRRVKVLLNNFATNLRIAESRGVHWEPVAPIIAKLTTLQTEFPHLAAELYQLPQLPELLLREPEEIAQLPERTRTLVERHRLPEEEDGRSDEHDSGSTHEAPSAYLRRASDPGAVNERYRVMQERDGRLLRRYLVRTADVGPLRREFIYLEPAGQTVGLNDPELGDLIEDLAPDDPREVVERVNAHDFLDDQVAALRLLAQMMEDLVGRERFRTATAMLTLVPLVQAKLHADGREIPAEAIGDMSKALNLLMFTSGGRSASVLEAVHLSGALRVALLAGERDLETAILEEPSLWDDNGRLREVAAAYASLAAGSRKIVIERLAEAIPEDPASLTEPLASLDDIDVLEVIGAPPIQEAVGSALAPVPGDPDTFGRSGDALLNQVFAVAMQRRTPQMLMALLDWFAEFRDLEVDSPMYRSLSSRWGDIEQRLSPPARVMQGFAMWTVAPRADWPTWARRVDADSKNAPVGASSGPIVNRLLAEYEKETLEEVARLADYFDLLGRYLEDHGEPDSSQWISALEAAFQAGTAEWATADGVERRRALYVGARSLASRVGPVTSDLVETLIVGDLATAMTMSGVLIGEALGAAREFGVRASDQRRRELLAAIPGYTSDDDADVYEQALVTRVELTPPGDMLPMSRDEAAWAAKRRKPAAQRALQIWLQSDQTRSDVVWVAKRAGRRLDEEPAAALRQWATQQTRSSLTAALRDLLSPTLSGVEAWVACLATGDFVERQVVDRLIELLTQAQNFNDRARLGARACALGPLGPAARRQLSDALRDVLKRRRKYDFANNIDVVMTFLPALAGDYPGKRSLARSIEDACRRHQKRLTKTDEAVVLAAGFTLSGDVLPKKRRSLRARLPFG